MTGHSTFGLRGFPHLAKRGPTAMGRIECQIVEGPAGVVVGALEAAAEELEAADEALSAGALEGELAAPEEELPSATTAADAAIACNSLLAVRLAPAR